MDQHSRWASEALRTDASVIFSVEVIITLAGIGACHPSTVIWVILTVVTSPT